MPNGKVGMTVPTGLPFPMSLPMASVPATPLDVTVAPPESFPATSLLGATPISPEDEQKVLDIARATGLSREEVLSKVRALAVQKVMMNAPALALTMLEANMAAMIVSPEDFKLVTGTALLNFPQNFMSALNQAARARQAYLEPDLFVQKINAKLDEAILEAATKIFIEKAKTEKEKNAIQQRLRASLILERIKQANRLELLKLRESLIRQRVGSTPGQMSRVLTTILSNLRRFGPVTPEEEQQIAAMIASRFGISPESVGIVRQKGTTEVTVHPREMFNIPMAFYDMMAQVPSETLPPIASDIVAAVREAQAPPQGGAQPIIVGGQPVHINVTPPGVLPPGATLGQMQQGSEWQGKVTDKFVSRTPEEFMKLAQQYSISVQFTPLAFKAIQEAAKKEKGLSEEAFRASLENYIKQFLFNRDAWGMAKTATLQWVRNLQGDVVALEVLDRYAIDAMVDMAIRHWFAQRKKYFPGDPYRYVQVGTTPAPLPIATGKATGEGKATEAAWKALPGGAKGGAVPTPPVFVSPSPTTQAAKAQQEKTENRVAQLSNLPSSSYQRSWTGLVIRESTLAALSDKQYKTVVDLLKSYQYPYRFSRFTPARGTWTFFQRYGVNEQPFPITVDATTAYFLVQWAASKRPWIITVQGKKRALFHIPLSDGTSFRLYPVIGHRVSPDGKVHFILGRPYTSITTAEWDTIGGHTWGK